MFNSAAVCRTPSHAAMWRLPLSPCGRGWLASPDARRVRGYGLSTRKNPLIRHGLRIADAKHRRPVKERRPEAVYGHLLPQGEKGSSGRWRLLRRGACARRRLSPIEADARAFAARDPVVVLRQAVACLLAADTMVAAGPGYDLCHVRPFGRS